MIINLSIINFYFFFEFFILIFIPNFFFKLKSTIHMIK